MTNDSGNISLQVQSLASLLNQADNALFFTGAGISTGSGIPDFRGPKGVWKRRKPVLYQEFLDSEESRVEHWDYKLEGFEQFQNARPNAAHRALAELERMGKLGTLVTQNIDGLHQEAGNTLVIELHGTNREVECVRCGSRSPAGPAFEEFRRVRRCPLCECGGFLKTATISFGQAMPEDLLEQAFAAAAGSDLAVSVGSTLEVQPAASVPLSALQKGVPYVVINRGPTAHDPVANLRIDGDVNEILPAVVAGLRMPDQ